MTITAIDAIGVLKDAPETVIKFRNLVLAWLGRDGDALARVFRDGEVAWLLDVATAFERHAERLSAFAQRLDAAEEFTRASKRITEDPEQARLFTSLRFEAAREATDDRRHLIACVTARTFFDDLSVNDKARIERTLRELDGDDLRYLYALDRSLISARERYARWEAYDRRSLLLAAGCVDIDYKPLAGLGGGGGPALHVSATGRLVLRAATVYLKQRGPAFPDDLRDPEPSAVDEQRIWDGVANNPAVIAFLARVRSAAPRTTYEPPPLPRTGDVAGAVFFWGVATDVETGLDPEKAATNALLTRGIVVERRELPDQTIVNVVLLGDHDTLRVVADRLEAVWNPYAPGRR